MQNKTTCMSPCSLALQLYQCLFKSRVVNDFFQCITTILTA